MLLVVGGCADGFAPEKNRTGDLLFTIGNGSEDLQMFWEAFPAAQTRTKGQRTTYMFCYTDTDPGRPTLEQLLDEYFASLPRYQGVDPRALTWRRVLFGGFPCYARAPLRPGFDRVLQIGDASAVQSPLSFGGFGTMVRHLPRLAEGADEALRGDHLDQADLALLQPYLPSLAAAWLFQRSMGFKRGKAAWWQSTWAAASSHPHCVVSCMQASCRGRCHRRRKRRSGWELRRPGQPARPAAAAGRRASFPLGTSTGCSAATLVRCSGSGTGSFALSFR